MIAFHGRVKIISCEEFPEYVGMEGYVSTMCIEDDGTVSGYGVMFEDENIEGCVFGPHELETTGEILSEEEFERRFYGDPFFLKVAVDKNGNGRIV